MSVPRSSSPLFVLGAFAVALLGGCEGSDASSVPAAGDPPFPGSAPTLDDLGESVLTALTFADTADLRSFQLTEEEHNLSVWPELPAANPEVNFPVDYAWENIQRRNLRSLGRMLPWFSGRDLEHVRTECRGPTEEFETFRVHTDCWEVFREAAPGGRVLEAKLFEEALERGGGFKVFRYDSDSGARPITE